MNRTVKKKKKRRRRRRQSEIKESNESECGFDERSTSQRVLGFGELLMRTVAEREMRESGTGDGEEKAEEGLGEPNHLLQNKK